MLLLWASLAIATVGGVVMLAVGLRGRRVDDHPICRGCGFDLVGLVVAGGATAGTICPECGAAVGAPRTIRIGRRRRRHGALALGLTLVLVSGAGVGGLAWSVRKGFNWNTVKPVWLLASEADGADPIGAQRALQELVSRLDRDEIGRSRLDGLVQVALRRQADPSRPWLTAWGDIVEQAHARDRLAPADWDRFVGGAVDVMLSARARIRRGDDLAADVGPSFRTGSGAALACRAVLTDIRLGESRPRTPPGTFIMEAIGGPFIGPPSGPAFWNPLVTTDIGMPAATADGRGGGADAWRLIADVEPGVYPLTVTFVVSVGSPKSGGPGGGFSTWTPYSWGKPGLLATLRIMPEPEWKPEADLQARLLAGEEISIGMGPNRLLKPETIVARRAVTRSVQVEVVAREAETVELDTDESKRPIVEKAISAAIVRDLNNPLFSRGWCCEVSFLTPPMDLAFDVFQQTARGERRLGRIAGRSFTQGPVCVFPLRRIAGAETDGYEIVLRPSAETACKTREITSIWGGEVRFTGLRPPEEAPVEAPP